MHAYHIDVHVGILWEPLLATCTLLEHGIHVGGEREVKDVDAMMHELYYEQHVEDRVAIGTSCQS